MSSRNRIPPPRRAGLTPLVVMVAASVSGVLAAVAGAFVATLAVIALARHGTGTERLLLAGIALNALLGAAFLLSVDDLARAIFPVEIPLGIVSAIIGAPFFIYLLGKSSKGWA